MSKLKFEKQESVYHCHLPSVSDYDALTVTQDVDGRIRIKFFEDRWRDVEEAKRLFREIADSLDSLPTKP